MQKKIKSANLLDSIETLNNIVQGKIQEALSETKLTSLQYQCLKKINSKKNSNMNTIATSLMITMSSATQLIDRLINLKYVKRMQDEEDRRVVKITLTETGKKELTRAVKQVQKKLEKTFEKIPKSRQKSLQDEQDYLIEKLIVKE